MNRQNNSWISRYNGIVEPNTQIFLEKNSAKKVERLGTYLRTTDPFQKKTKPYSLKNAISVELHLPIRSNSASNTGFMENDFFR